MYSNSKIIDLGNIEDVKRLIMRDFKNEDKLCEVYYRIKFECLENKIINAYVK